MSRGFTSCLSPERLTRDVMKNIFFPAGLVLAPPEPVWCEGPTGATNQRNEVQVSSPESAP